MSKTKTNNLRETSQQQLILNYLLRCNDHPAAEDIFQVVRQSLPKISLATVYRNLVKLEDNNLITSYYFFKGKARYEFGVHSHYHFVCATCGRIMHLEIDSLVALNEQVAKRHSLQVNYHQLNFYGHCPACLKVKNDSKV